MGSTGTEETSKTAGKRSFLGAGGADCGALPEDLGFVVAHWPALTDDDRRRVRAIVEGRLA